MSRTAPPVTMITTWPTRLAHSRRWDQVRGKGGTTDRYQAHRARLCPRGRRGLRRSSGTCGPRPHTATAAHTTSTSTGPEGEPLAGERRAQPLAQGSGREIGAPAPPARPGRRVGRHHDAPADHQQNPGAGSLSASTASARITPASSTRERDERGGCRARSANTARPRPAGLPAHLPSRPRRARPSGRASTTGDRHDRAEHESVPPERGGGEQSQHAGATVEGRADRGGR